MKNKLWLFAIPAFLAASAASAASVTVVNFNDYFDTTENGYNWLLPVDISTVPANSGFASLADKGSTSFYSAVYEKNPITFTYIGEGDYFTLDSFWFANAWGTQDVVTITGYKDGKVVGSPLSFQATTTATQYTPGWEIDSFVIEASGNFTPTTTPPVWGQAWALGTTAITPGVPEPESYAMLLAGLALVGAVARRRAASR
ncbi:MAG: PEP-CTERM sorting domain-containing protein [Azoarcus sp.]|jgi:hypothetical protein|nr:PEP-CTERM sorting domain-containing protein [Azoarcus sp.]